MDTPKKPKVPICSKLSKMTTKRFFSQSPKIMKNYPNLTRKHSKEPHDPKLSKTIRFIMIKHQIAQNRVKVATDANIFEDKTFFEVPLKNFLLTS